MAKPKTRSGTLGEECVREALAIIEQVGVEGLESPRSGPSPQRLAQGTLQLVARCLLRFQVAPIHQCKDISLSRWLVSLPLGRAQVGSAHETDPK